MKKLTDESFMPFGQHKGTRLKDVPAPYLLWLLDSLSGEDRIRLFCYLNENRAALEQEVKESGGDKDDDGG